MSSGRVIDITNWFYIIIPLVLLCAVIGFRRGWKIEAVTAAGVLFTGLVLAEAGNALINIVNKLPKLVYFLIGEDIPDVPPLIQGAGNEALFKLGVFAIGIVLFYMVPNVFIKRPTGIPGTKNTTSTWGERFVGAFIGGLTGFMIFNLGLQWIADFIEAYPSSGKMQVDLQTTIILPPPNELLDPAKWFLVAKPLVLVGLMGSVLLAVIYFTILCPKKGDKSG
ncbi:MAG: hypothetical protein KKA73_28450 [Chloroflexi bacterium]|nr:hypothetical protein [Chloroflexota bacterium]MBU1751625.1 hypothetical protein [Chloroflexota bacterium]